MNIWRRALDWLGLTMPPIDNCLHCRVVPYIHEERLVTLPERLQIAPRLMLVEVCPRCGRSGGIVGPAEPQPSYGWRTINEPYRSGGR